MKDEDLNAKIATICGWKKYDHFPTGLLGRSEKKWKSPDKGCLGQIDSAPDYCNDLNAMHDAEKVMDEPHRLQYQCEVGGFPSDNDNWHAVHATAKQRAEAFLIVMQND